MSFKLTIGKISILGTDAFYNEAIVALFPKCEIVRNWLFHCLPTLNLSKESSGAIKGATLNRKKLEALLVPVPPVAEQERIIAKVKHLMSMLDDLEQRQEKKRTAAIHVSKASLDSLVNAEDPDQLARAWERVSKSLGIIASTKGGAISLRKAIERLAVRGRLIQPLPTDGSAETLLHACRNWVMQQVTEQRFRSVLLQDAEPPRLRLPQGWVWARFAELGEFGRGKSKHRPRNDPSLYLGGTIPFIQTGDVSSARPYIGSPSFFYNDKGLAQSRQWPTGTLCITIAANIAETGILAYDACFPDSVVGFRAAHPLGSVEYIELFIRTIRDELETFAPATAQKNINLAILNEVFIPLPPRSAMDRIMARVSSMMTIIDELERSSASLKRTASALAAAVARIH